MITAARRGRNAGSGFTVIEVLMVTALLGALLALAMPNFTAFITKSRISGITNQFLGDLSYARSEAATRQAEVAICVSTNQTACESGKSWDKGRIIFVDTNADGAVSAGERVLRVSQAMSDTNVTASGFGAAEVVRFRPFGGLRPATAGSFKICPTSGTEGRSISVASSGRPMVAKVTCP